MSGSDKRISDDRRVMYAGICHVSLSESRETKTRDAGVDGICSGCVSSCCFLFCDITTWLTEQNNDFKGNTKCCGCDDVPRRCKCEARFTRLLSAYNLRTLASGYHIVFICQFVDEIWKIICVWRKSQASAEDMEEKRSLWIRGGCVVVLFLLFLWMGRFLGERDAGRAFMSYIAAVDIPLSVLVPAFAGRKRTNPGKLAKMAA